MVSDDPSYDSEMGERREKMASVSDHLTSSSKCGSVVVDIERVAKDAINSNSRILRNLSRKGSIRVNGEMKLGGNDRDGATTSPRGASTALHGGGGSTPEKASLAVVAVGPTTDHHHPHHQITITTASGGCGGGSGGGGVVVTESKWAAAKRLSFRRSTHPTWTLDPRRILFFFATLSSMGTILLIYFTLSMGKLNASDNASI